MTQPSAGRAADSPSGSGGELLAFGSAKPKTEDFFLSGTYDTWYGRAQAAIWVLSKELRINVQSERHGTAVWE